MSLEPLFKQAKEQLPNLPDDVYAWLCAIISEYGWPPNSDEWKGIMPGGLLLWKLLVWEKKYIKINFNDLSNTTQVMLLDYNITHTTGQVTPVTKDVGVQISIERYNRIKSYIEEHNKLPAPLIFFQSVEHLIDGGHRISAMKTLGKERGIDLFPEKVEIWIGKYGL